MVCSIAKRSWFHLLTLALVAGCSQQDAERLGIANSDGAKSTAVALQQVAQNLGKGLKTIRQGLDDAELAGKVYARIMWDKKVRQTKVTIVAKPNGIIELDGAVESKDIQNRILDLAANTVGVREVIDKLTIERPNTPAPATRTAGRESFRSTR